jgi:hypothetical protein
MSDPYGPPNQPNQPSPWSPSGYPQQPGYPSSGAPASGYPGSGYPQQPDYQQPYPSSGYPGSTYPSSGSGYYQPAADPYQQGGYQQGGYQQPQPGMYGAPPPKRKSHGVLIGIIAGLVVLALAGGAAVYITLTAKDKNSTPTVQTRGTDSTTSTKPPSSAAATKASVTLAAPDRIGSLRKSADQSQANNIRQRMVTAGVESPYAVVYEDTSAPGRTAAVWGGTGRAFAIGGPDKQIDAFFSSASKDLGGGTVGARTTVDPGAVGGKAQCAKVDGLGVTMSMCAWAGTDALLGFVFGGLDVTKSTTTMRSMLAVIVAKS